MVVPYWKVRLQQIAREWRKPPNLISLLRPYFLFWVAGYIYTENYLLGLILHLVGAFTDILDGWVARKTNTVTDTGKMIDPLMDKLYFVPTLVMLRPPEGIGDILVWLIACESMLLIMGLYAFFTPTRRITLGANFYGKTKVWFEIGATVILFLEKSHVFTLRIGIIELVIGMATLCAFLSICGHNGVKNRSI